MAIKCPRCGKPNEVRPEQKILQCSCGKAFIIRQKTAESKASNQIEKIVFKKNFLKKTLIVFNCPKCGSKLNELLESAHREDACPECHQGFRFSESSWGQISYKQNFVDRESLQDLKASKERVSRIKHLFAVGVKCQWMKDSTAMLSELQSFERVSIDGNYAFFPNSSSGVPLEEVVTD